MTNTCDCHEAYHELGVHRPGYQPPPPVAPGDEGATTELSRVVGAALTRVSHR